MPVHRIAGEYPSLKAAVNQYEGKGEQVVQIVEQSDAWVIVTTAAPKPSLNVVSTTGQWQERVA